MTDPIWRGATLAGHAAARPAAPAILAPEGVVDWATFHRQIEAAAGHLHRLGIGRRDPVAIVMRRTGAHLAALFALQRIGAGVLLLDADEPAALQAALIDQVAARHVLGTGAPIGGAVPHRVPRFGLAEERIDLPVPDDDATCFYSRTSGTTNGVPKLTPISHRHEHIRGVANAMAMPRTVDDRYLAIVAMSFPFGCRSAQRALMSGGAVILPPPVRDVAEIVAVARAQGATWTALTPHHLREMLACAAEPPPLLPQMSILVSTAALTVAEREAAMARISPHLYISYGANEVGGVVMAGPDDLRRHPGTVGRPLFGVDVEVVDEHRHPLPAGAVGELRLRHEIFPEGYVAAAPGATGRFLDGWFYPGDLGTIDSDGLVFLRGRVDDLINVGGRKIYPVDIEECLMRHPAVANVAAFGMAAQKRGEIAVAAVVARMPVTPDALKAHCRERLGPDRTPNRIWIVDAIPVTPLGKPDKRVLRETMLAARGREAPGPEDA